MKISTMEKDLYSISTICKKGRYNATSHLAEDSQPVNTCAAPVYSIAISCPVMVWLTEKIKDACLGSQTSFVLLLMKTLRCSV